MLIGLQLVLVIGLLAVTLKIGAVIGDTMEDALGDKPLRERARDELKVL
jgi:hypothetical protein